MECIFCKIISGEIPSKKIYEDETICAFYDAEPQAPVHFLIIPKQHIQSANEINSENSKIISHIYETTAKLCRELGLQNGYRIVTNCGEQAGQTVLHLHFHVLGGRLLSWPPG